ncbi:hypothetical protein [Nonomuraea sp. LPB2021202275-12-8]|uniref:hypothetical protein n=1 Tax=Nonomuraea sp. LPB2021202275-12-8 TaxID=3120159 RepID=UPI00300D4D0C
MALELDPDWPGLTEDHDISGDPYAKRPEINRIAGDIDKLLKKLTTSSAPPVTQVLSAPGPEDDPPLPGLPENAGSLPDLRTYGALSEVQLGQWTTPMQLSFTVQNAYNMLVGASANSGGKYTMLVEKLEPIIEALFETAKTSQVAEQANQEAAARQDV